MSWLLVLATQVRQCHPGQQRQADPALEDSEGEHERLGDAVQDRAEHDRQRRPFGLGAARVLALAAAVAGQLLTRLLGAVKRRLA